jgi:hypothetical protein
MAVFVAWVKMRSAGSMVGDISGHFQFLGTNSLRLG